MRIRIKDIARLAQVSTGTVDRVIHNRGEVSDRTCKKIEQIIKDLDYKPDIMARTLASKRNIVFSVLMPVSVNDDDFWNSPRAGIDKAMAEVSPFGVDVRYYFFDQYDSNSFIECSEKILEAIPDAVLFAPVFPKESINFFRQCRNKEIPIMLFNSNLEEAQNMLYIGQDSLQSGYLGAKLLHYGMKEEGDVLIVNIAGRKDNHNHILRRERGFRKYFVDHPQISSGIITIDCIQDQCENLEQLLHDVMNKYRVRAIFVSNSRVSMVADYLQKYEVKDVRLLGYDLLPQNVKALKDGLIDFLISQKPEEQGYKGIMTLFNTIVLKRDVEQSQYIPIDIITRENIDYYEYK